MVCLDTRAGLGIDFDGILMQQVGAGNSGGLGRGWVEVHGEEKKFIRQGELKSNTAQAMEASWIERGYRKTKIYSQKTHHYLVLRFFCEDGDEFVAVMKKRK